MKFSSNFMTDYRQRISSNQLRRDIVFLFLAIVFDGPLYEATSETGTWSLKPANHILLESGRYSKAGSYASYLMDIVSREYLPNYLELLNDDARLISQDFTWNAQRLLALADKAMKNMTPLTVP